MLFARRARPALHRSCMRGRSSGERSRTICTGSALVNSAADASQPSWRIAVAAPLPVTVLAGAPVRLTRTARFALYRGGTSEHWLGFAEVQPSTAAWITIQPVSGPYLPFNAGAPATSGVSLAGRDSSGTAITPSNASRMTAVSLSTRTLTTRTVRIDGLTRGLYGDSLHSLMNLRNAR